MFVNEDGGYWKTGAPLTERERKLLGSKTIKTDVDDAVEWTAVLGFLVAIFPGGLVWLFALLLSSNWYIILPAWLASFMTTVALGWGIYHIGEKRIKSREALLKSSDLYHWRGNNAYAKLFAQVDYDEKLLERHKDAVDDYLCDPDRRELRRIRRKATSEMRKLIDKRLNNDRERFVQTLRELDRPYQDDSKRIRAEAKQREDAEEEEKRLEREARQAAIDEHARWLLGEQAPHEQ